MLNFLKRLLSTGPKPGPLGVDELARRLGVSENELRTIDIAYHTFNVPKRTGGMRTIQAPSPALKAMHRRILHKLLRRLKAHPCATGFERGHSIVTNAQPHVGQELVIKLDLRDFFTATTANRVEKYFYKIGWNAAAAAVLARLCTYRGSLPQGAPTSPRLSNLLNYRLDARLFALAQARGLAYSRYADDMTFSGPARAPALKNNPTLEPKPSDVYRVNDIVHLVKDIVAEEGYALHTEKKLRIARRHQRQVVTGLIVNQSVQLPRKTRRWLRAVEHRLAKTGRSTLSPQQLQGWRALHSMVRSGTA